MKKKKVEDTFGYKGWMNSDNIWKRMFGVFGYYTLANIVITLGMLLVFGVFVFLGFLVTWLVR